MRTLVIGLWLAGLLGGLVWDASPAAAQYGRTPESDFNPEILSIDDQKFLGTQLPKDLGLVDHEGNRFTLGSLMGKPLVVVLSYYQCDGTCSVINQDWKAMMEGMTRNELGKDYRVVTITFDEKDTMETLQAFRAQMKLTGSIDENWTWTMVADKTQIKSLTDTVGFNFFWSPRDRTFFHPGVFIVTSPQGRITRYLYALSNEPADVDLALVEARTEQMKATPKDLINYAVSLCYSYNFQEGRYTINYPLFIALGSLLVGVSSLAGGIVYFKRNHPHRHGREAC